MLIWNRKIQINTFQDQVKRKGNEKENENTERYTTENSISVNP